MHLTKFSAHQSYHCTVHCTCDIVFCSPIISYIQSICAKPEARKRILTSYELMLDFYGMKLKDPETGMFILCMYIVHFSLGVL